MSLIILPSAISQPVTQASAAAPTPDRKGNDAVSFGAVFKHSLASGSNTPAVAKDAAATPGKAPARAAVRREADSADASPQDPVAALLFALIPASATTANPATGNNMPTLAETQLNQAIAASSGQHASPGTPLANAGTADSAGAAVAMATPSAAQPAVAVASGAQTQRQQTLPGATDQDSGDPTTLAPASGSAIPLAAASDTGSAQQHTQRGHDKNDAQASQPDSPAAPLHSAAQTIASAADAATPQSAVKLADQISPGALLALNPTPAPSVAAIIPPAAATPLSLPLTPPVGSSEWAGALSQQVVWMGNASHQVAELHLNPPDLGPLKVTLTMNDNQAQAIFVSGHESVRAAVEAALPQLRTTLADNGISLGHTSVSADTPQQQGAFAQNQNDQPPQRSSRSSTVAAGSTPLASAVPLSNSSKGMVDTFA